VSVKEYIGLPRHILLFALLHVAVTQLAASAAVYVVAVSATVHTNSAATFFGKTASGFRMRSSRRSAFLLLLRVLHLLGLARSFLSFLPTQMWQNVFMKVCFPFRISLAIARVLAALSAVGAGRTRSTSFVRRSDIAPATGFLFISGKQ
jgi:hypothetical protein